MDITKIKFIDDQIIDVLAVEAGQNSRGRKAHLYHEVNFDGSSSDHTQRLLNVILFGSYVPPHRFDGWQTITLLRGEMDLFVWTPQGKLANKRRLSIGDTVIFEADNEMYHSWVALQPINAILEYRPGPYRGDRDKYLLEGFPSEHPEHSEAAQRLVKQWEKGEVTHPISSQRE